MIGYDIDGVITAGVQPSAEAVIISGRTWAEYDATARTLAQQWPVYIRGAGAYGDQHAAGVFKARMIELLGVSVFHEDDPIQAQIIKAACPHVTLIQVGS